ncbi:conserved hypothetical protein [uncultured Pleomorphomonas sp.]|uniref:GapR-like DNA-binding domain-containing protein n=1 Tax=uncultured Pleomorphomonas sp. TaxID=442121 RepID=A0A212L2A1_9HYPH|nr:GapR family DNA-binding domain-containing protein [uncultured Pleomorphomonas sp.]SCM71675.1 conserved hypothetical protein [uncultured Pleomorphomonas sp.]
MSQEPESLKLLKSITDRIIRLETQKREIAADVKDVYQEAKGLGLSPAAIRKTVKEYFETPEARAKREEIEAIAEIYKANLGMLGGTPLGEAARARLNRQNRHETSEYDPDIIQPAAPEPEPEPEQTISPADIEAARQRGRDDALAGKKILDNPFVSGDPRRAAWDEGHCEITGSDGMDIPDAWKPRLGGKKPDASKAKPDKEPDTGEDKPDESKPDDGEGGEG